MPPVHRKRPAIRAPTLSPALAPTPMAPPNDLFQEFMQTFIEKTQASIASVAPAPNIEARDNTDRPLKPRNPNLNYGNLHMECYYFCQQCEDHFEVARSLGHKCVPFVIKFLKDHILNW